MCNRCIEILFFKKTTTRKSILFQTDFFCCGTQNKITFVNINKKNAPSFSYLLLIFSLSLVSMYTAKAHTFQCQDVRYSFCKKKKTVSVRFPSLIIIFERRVILVVPCSIQRIWFLNNPVRTLILMVANSLFTKLMIIPPFTRKRTQKLVCWKEMMLTYKTQLLLVI